MGVLPAHAYQRCRRCPCAARIGLPSICRIVPLYPHITMNLSRPSVDVMRGSAGRFLIGRQRPKLQHAPRGNNFGASRNSAEVGEAAGLLAFLALAARPVKMMTGVGAAALWMGDELGYGGGRSLVRNFDLLVRSWNVLNLCGFCVLRVPDVRYDCNEPNMTNRRCSYATYNFRLEQCAPNRHFLTCQPLRTDREYFEMTRPTSVFRLDAPPDERRPPALPRASSARIDLCPATRPKKSCATSASSSGE